MCPQHVTKLTRQLMPIVSEDAAAVWPENKRPTCSTFEEGTYYSHPSERSERLCFSLLYFIDESKFLQLTARRHSPSRESSCAEYVFTIGACMMFLLQILGCFSTSMAAFFDNHKEYMSPKGTCVVDKQSMTYYGWRKSSTTKFSLYPSGHSILGDPPKWRKISSLHHSTCMKLATSAVLLRKLLREFLWQSLKNPNYILDLDAPGTLEAACWQ